jgi:hypothetical protein
VRLETEKLDSGQKKRGEKRKEKSHVHTISIPRPIFSPSCKIGEVLYNLRRQVFEPMNSDEKLTLKSNDTKRFAPLYARKPAVREITANLQKKKNNRFLSA